jgi:hypothetical protein
MNIRKTKCRCIYVLSSKIESFHTLKIITLKFNRLPFETVVFPYNLVVLQQEVDSWVRRSLSMLTVCGMSSYRMSFCRPLVKFCEEIFFKSSALSVANEFFLG